MTLKTNSWHRAVVAFMLMLGTVGVGALVAVPQDQLPACWSDNPDDNCCNVHVRQFNGKVHWCNGQEGDPGAWPCILRKIVSSDTVNSLELAVIGGSYNHARESWDTEFQSKKCFYKDFKECGDGGTPTTFCLYYKKKSFPCDDHVYTGVHLDCEVN